MLQRIAVLVVLVTTLFAGTAVAPGAPAPQPPLDISKLDYSPLGHFKPPATLPANAGTACQEAALPLRKGEIFNPSGKWNAFDNNVYETLCLPFRGPGDTTDNDPVGNKGAAQHGTCGGRPGPEDSGTFVDVAGVCDNHQLEWSRYYAETMKEILKDFGVTVRQHAFQVPAGGNTRGGRAINTSVVIPGADNPDEQIVVGAHYDKTLDAPAAAWDSQEGHAEMIRMAKIMADYWKATGTRPSATIKFIPWDAEESGVLGSADYAQNNIVPGEEFKVRGYWNTDPCAGGYPSYRYGNPADRLKMGIQLADPGAIAGVSPRDAARITGFNQRSEQLLQQVLDRVDDKVDAADGEHDVFISNAEGGGSGDVGKQGGIAIGSDRPILFSSDWASFEVLGIPFFNPGPEVTGPNQESSGEPNYGLDQSADAVTTFHTPNDNLRTMFRFTQFDPTGSRYSASWAKGMEFCSNLLAWGMLQHDQGGAQRVNNDVVAYYEALPNEAKEDQNVSFDASGSHQTPASGDLEYIWDFGDGNTGRGRVVDHAYNAIGLYQSKLTVRNTATGQTDTMSIPITVLPNDVQPPTLERPAPTDADGTYDLKFDYAGDRKNLRAFSIEESTNASTPINETADTMNAWEPSKDVPPTVAPWQLSDSPTPKYHGNVNTSKPRSFWTGVPNGQNTYQQGPEEGQSILTLKEAVQLPRGSNAALAYNSSFVSDTGDKGKVQVAVETDATDRLEWITVDSFATGSADADSLSIFEERQGDQSGAKNIKRRFADLTRFAGRKVKMRFIYELGPHDPTFPFARPGWYVDDIRVVAGTYREIGQTAAKTFTVANRKKGTYGYRVKAVFDDNVKSSASNSESVTVTVGDPNGPGADGGASAGGGACGFAAAVGYRTLAVKPIKRDLRFDITTATEPATIDIVRVGSTSRALKPKRIARLKNVTGPVTFKRKRLTDGFYYARITARNGLGAKDVRTVSLRRVKGRFRTAKAFTRLASCGLLSTYSLNSPVFNGKRPLTARLTTTQPARVVLQVFRGTKAKKPVRRYVRTTRPNKAVRVRIKAGKLRRGDYRVVATVTRPGERGRATLYARRQR